MPEPCTVLVVDDEPAVSKLIGRMVSAAGCQPAVVNSGREAVAWISGNPQPQAVVLDLLMPGEDGLVTLQKLRELGYGGPIVVCSGLTNPAAAEEARRMGAAGFVDKTRDLRRIPELLKPLLAR